MNWIVGIAFVIAASAMYGDHKRAFLLGSFNAHAATKSRAVATDVTSAIISADPITRHVRIVVIHRLRCESGGTGDRIAVIILFG